MAYLDNGVFNWPYDWNTILAHLFILCGKTGGKKRGEGGLKKEWNTSAEQDQGIKIIR